MCEIQGSCIVIYTLTDKIMKSNIRYKHLVVYLHTFLIDLNFL